jgi:hypothetical protein
MAGKKRQARRARPGDGSRSTPRRGWLTALCEKVDGRLLVLAAVVLFFATYWLCLSHWDLNLLREMGVWVMSPSFADTRVIVGAWESVRQGFDPLVSNPGDPWHAPMNYPRVWLLLEKTGLTQADVPAIGLTLAALFYIVATGLVIPKKPGARATLLWLAALLSPAVLLGVERGNIDLVVFMLVAAGVAGLTRESLAVRISFYGILLVAAILKLFPVMALVTIAKEKPRTFIALGAAFALAFAAYIALTFDDVMTLLRTTEHGLHISYGSSVLFANMDRLCTGVVPGRDPYGGYVQVEGWATAALALVIAFLWLRCVVNVSALSDGRYLSAFRAGAAIYVGTYLAGHNWEYRLVFLLLVLPQLLDWAANTAAGRLPRLTLAVILVTMWSALPLQWMASRTQLSQAAMARELFNWLLFAILAYLLVATLPDWLRPRAMVSRSSR